MAECLHDHESKPCENSFSLSPMMTLRQLATEPPTLPTRTTWYLTDLAEARGKQELFTRQSPQKLQVLREHALIESAVSSNRIEGVEVDQSRVATLIFGKPDADPFDLLCHLAFNAPVLTRRQRADRVKRQQTAFFNYYAPEAREILSDLLEKYAADGELQFTLPDVLKLPPISHHGNVNEIIGKFGGPDQLRNAVNQLQSLLYAT